MPMLVDSPVTALQEQKAGAKGTRLCRPSGSVDSWVNWMVGMLPVPVVVTRCALPLGIRVCDTRSLMLLAAWSASQCPPAPDFLALPVV